MKENKLKSCPDCGGIPRLRRIPLGAMSAFYIKCDNCDTRTGTRFFISEAIEEWNNKKPYVDDSIGKEQ